MFPDLRNYILSFNEDVLKELKNLTACLDEYLEKHFKSLEILKQLYDKAWKQKGRRYN